MAVVIPPPGRLKETARALLDIAGDVPEIVRTISNGTQFEVPDELAEIYHQRMGRTPVTEPRPAPKRRGRTPRVSEEE